MKFIYDLWRWWREESKADKVHREAMQQAAEEYHRAKADLAPWVEELNPPKA